ncbi:50S ribosomal protein L13 [Atractiella rhizophila]|nr:50S ribosomal protein L13 [Atractiella rhizophila]
MSTRIGYAGLAHARVWRSVDARSKILGRLASQIAPVLMGKHKPTYNPAVDAGDYVVVTNARHIVVTGRKRDSLVYRHHSGFPGGLKEIPFRRMMEFKPEEIIRKAVSGMLPKNRLRKRRLERLIVFPDERHPYEGNVIKDWTKPPSSTASPSSGSTESGPLPRTGEKGGAKA